MSEINREELIAFTEAHAKSAIALERITGHLEDIAIKQDKIVDKLNNGISQNIVEGVTKNYSLIHEETVEALKRLEQSNKDIIMKIEDKIPVTVESKINSSSIATDIRHFKLFMGVVSLIIIVAIVVLRSIDNRIIFSKQMQVKQKESVVESIIEEMKKKPFNITGD